MSHSKISTEAVFHINEPGNTLTTMLFLLQRAVFLFKGRPDSIFMERFLLALASKMMFSNLIMTAVFLEKGGGEMCWSKQVSLNVLSIQLQAKSNLPLQ